MTDITKRLEADPREEKLPQWAQATLRNLRQLAAEQNRELEEQARAGVDGRGQIVLDMYSEYMRVMPTPSGGEVVRFYLDPVEGDARELPWSQRHVDAAIRKDPGGEPYLALMTSEGAAVRPKATNMVQLFVVKF